MALNGKRITPTHNNNFANANIPSINRTIEELKLQPRLTPRVNARWAALDRQVMEQALWAPYYNPQLTDFFGPSIDTKCYVNHVVYFFEWAYICKKT